MDLNSAIQASREVIELHKASCSGNISHPIPVLSPRDMSSDAAVPASGIVKTVSDMVGLPINISRISGAMGDALNGYMLRYEDRVEIAYSSKLNLCWSRFVMCKELAHVFLGNEGNYTSTSERAEQLLVELFNDTPMLRKPDYLVETSAMYAATELLLPKEFMKDVRDMKEQGLTNLEIAMSYRVPAKLVAFRYDIPEVAEIFER